MKGSTMKLTYTIAGFIAGLTTAYAADHIARSILDRAEADELDRLDAEACADSQADGERVTSQLIPRGETIPVPPGSVWPHTDFVREELTRRMGPLEPGDVTAFASTEPEPHVVVVVGQVYTESPGLKLSPTAHPKVCTCHRGADHVERIIV